MSDNRQPKRTTLLVAGSGRSGTTWIQSVLADCDGCLAVFEPLNARRVPAVPVRREMPEFPGLYLDPTRDDPRWRAFFEDLFRGRIENRWTRQDWTRVGGRPRGGPIPEWLAYWLARQRYRRASRRSRTLVIKTIRCNLMLEWVAARFDIRLLFVLRHPCAVVASRLRLHWPSELTGIACQPELINRFLRPFDDVIAGARDELERMTVLWCVENHVGLEMTFRAGGSPQFYETLRGQDEDQWEAWTRAWGLTPTDASRRARRRLHSNALASQPTERGWHAGLGESDGRRVLDLCRRFGIEFYGRSETVEPRPGLGLAGAARET